MSIAINSTATTKNSKVFYSSYSSYLQQSVNLPASRSTLKKFSDGELYIKIEEVVANQDVWVVGATPPPAENLLELWLLLDALKRSGARIRLLLTYYGYGRQDRAAPGESLSAALLAQFFKAFNLQGLFIIHAHSKRLHNYIEFTNEIPVEQICSIAENYDAIAAPDAGAYKLTTRIADECKKEKIFLAKIRPEHEQVTRVHTVGRVENNIENKNILVVEDIIATGNTLIEVSRALKKHKAKTVAVYATHGVFTGNALANLEKEQAISHIYTTNSLYQSCKVRDAPKVTVIDIGQYIRQIIDTHS